MLIPILVLMAVFALIAVRQVGRFKLKIWPIMLLGAIAVLVTGQTTPREAFEAIDFDVILFLFGMFVVGQALEQSGYLSHLAYKMFRKARTLDSMLLLVIFGTGIFSAFLMNDTLAIIGTPVMLLLAKRHGIRPKILLLALAFSVTIGSVMSPIGNPQNLLVAINGDVGQPFITFFKYLLIPTMINLVLCYAVLKLFFKEQLRNVYITHSGEPIRDYRLAMISKVSLILIIALIAVKMASVLLGMDFRLTYIALIAAAPVLMLSRQRMEVLKRMDWYTLIFFAAMFILMDSVWQSGFFQSLFESLSIDIASIPAILGVSVALSQLISNVPLVALYLPMLAQAGASVKGMMALAAGSTIAGNLSILGAASNVIIIQKAEGSGKTLTFLEFLKVGSVLTALNLLVYWLFFMLL